MKLFADGELYTDHVLLDTQTGLQKYFSNLQTSR